MYVCMYHKKHNIIDMVNAYNVEYNFRMLICQN